VLEAELDLVFGDGGANVTEHSIDSAGEML
jgi:hypothetical protein